MAEAYLIKKGKRKFVMVQVVYFEEIGFLNPDPPTYKFNKAEKAAAIGRMHKNGFKVNEISHFVDLSESSIREIIKNLS